MVSYGEKIKELEDEIKKTKYNKATQHHIGLVKAKIAILKAIALYPLTEKSSKVCVEALDDSNVTVKYQAIRTISALKATAAIPKLIKLTNSSYNDEILRVMDGLSIFPTDEVINSLIKLFYHNNRKRENRKRYSKQTEND